MRLSVSVRIAEGFLSKEIPILSLEQVCKIAKAAGYQAICMRASQVGVHSDEQVIEQAVGLLSDYDLSVSMVTGDFDTVYNNDRGPQALRNIQPYLQLATRLKAPLVRVALKQSMDIVAAQTAADQAREAGIQLAHQCHTLSLFETVDGILETLERIGRPNFGLIYEPANLELCGQDYANAIAKLAPFLLNVYLQNQILRDDGAVTLDTWCRGPSSFDIVPVHATGGIDFETIFAALKKVGYDGTVTVHQSAGENEDPQETSSATAEYLRSLL